MSGFFRSFASIPRSPSYVRSCSKSGDKADIAGLRVCATCGLMHRSKKASLDHLVRAGEQGRWDGEAKHARGLVVDNKLELRRLRHRQVCGLRALEDAAGIRVPAPEVENIVVQALREHLNGSGAAQQPPDPGDRELVERHVERIVIKSHAINVFLRLETADEMNQVGPDSMADSDGNGSNPVMLALPWTAPRPIAARDKPA